MPPQYSSFPLSVNLQIFFKLKKFRTVGVVLGESLWNVRSGWVFSAKAFMNNHVDPWIYETLGTLGDPSMACPGNHLLALSLVLDYDCEISDEAFMNHISTSLTSCFWFIVCIWQPALMTQSLTLLCQDWDPGWIRCRFCQRCWGSVFDPGFKLHFLDYFKYCTEVKKVLYDLFLQSILSDIFLVSTQKYNICFFK